jgi:hypothetical protein
MLILSQYHIFESYKINIYSVEEGLSYRSVSHVACRAGTTTLCRS